MSNIAIYNLEPKYVNIALEKIKLFHSINRDNVENYNPLKHKKYDKIYCSSIFKFTPKPSNLNDMIYGGTGFNLTEKLPEYIEKMKPKINIGFTSRGCIRKCGFCVVPKKEGSIKITGDIYDIWDGSSKKIILLDNNIIALKNHFLKICNQIKKENLKVDFRQGLDARLIKYDQIRLLKSIRHFQYKFAWDGIENLFFKYILLRLFLKRCRVYILVGNSSLWWVKVKLYFLRFIGHEPYLMRLEKVRKTPIYIELARWVNQPNMFKKMRFMTFVKKYASKKNKKVLIK
jgi:hypothetical protein